MENNEERFKVVSETAILVNLDALPKLPFDKATIESNIGSGWVRVEKREAEGPDSGRDELYVDGRKVILYLPEQQKGRKVMRGFKLNEELSGKPVLHPNILDALLKHPDFIPEEWNNKSGNTRYIFFWAVIFRGSGGGLFVRCLCFRGGQCFWDGRWLARDWGARSTAALLKS